MASRSLARARGGATRTDVAGSVSAWAPAQVFLERLVVAGDGLAYSSGLAALVGAAMTGAVGLAFDSNDVPRAASLVGCGAFFIYNVDRLRDLTRDRPSSPGRTAFVLRHRRALLAATALAGLALAALLATSRASFAALTLAIGSVGLLHRRLKRDVRWKIAYVAAAWTTACVGLPWLAGHASTSPARVATAAWAVLFVGGAVVANLIASNLRVGKANAPGHRTEAALLGARGLTLAVVCIAGAAPADVAPLAWIPAAEAASLWLFRETERFGHLAVDGALLIGALVAIAQTSA